MGSSTRAGHDSGSAVLCPVGYAGPPAGLAEVSNLFTDKFSPVSNMVIVIISAFSYTVKRDISNERLPGKQGYRRHPRYRALTGLRAERDSAIDELYGWLERHGLRSFSAVKTVGLDL